MGKIRVSRIFDIFFGLISLMFCGMAILSFLGKYILPSHVNLQWAILSIQLILLTNLVFFFFWTLQRKWRFAAIPLFALLLNITYYPKIYQLPSFNFGNDKTGTTIRIGTYNVRNFCLDDNGNSVDSITKYISQKKLDMLCLQEVSPYMSLESLKNIFSQFRYVYLTPYIFQWSNVAILSRFPLDSAKTLSSQSWPNYGLMVNTTIHHKKFRIITCHLQTTSWNQLKGEQPIRDQLGILTSNFFKIDSVILQNSRFRASQADSIRSLIDSSPYPTIVCGDFNDPPSSYTYHKIKGNLADSFCEAGHGYGYSYRFLHKLFRIDYILFSPKSFRAVNYISPEIDFSDHQPVIADIGLK